MVWEEGDRGSGLPRSHALHFRFPPPSVVATASVCLSYCEMLRNVAKKKKSNFSLLPLPCEAEWILGTVNRIIWG